MGGVKDTARANSSATGNHARHVARYQSKSQIGRRNIS